MPLPVPQNCVSADGCLGNGNSVTNSPTPTLQRGTVSELRVEDVRLRTGRYDQQLIQYIDFLFYKKEVLGDRPDAQVLEAHFCGENPLCQNNFESLNTLLRYEFVFADGSPVVGQTPILSTPTVGESDSPFRRVFQVRVPLDYQANSIQSEVDLKASQYRVDPTERVETNLVIYDAEAPEEVLSRFQSFNPPLIIREAWHKAKKVRYLDLGSVPFSELENRPGSGLIFFMRNLDNQALPSEPAPIFDSVPEDLLYSPLRQVFRARAENQIDSTQGDPSRSVFSQEALFSAVNQGVFKLEEQLPKSYFIFPVVNKVPLSLPQQIFELNILSSRFLPTLKAPRHYALWTQSKQGAFRLIQRFQNPTGSLLSLDGNTLSSPGTASSLFRFSASEVQNLDTFFVTVENAELASPSDTRILQARFQGGETIQLQFPFQKDYQAVSPGQAILSSPTSPESTGNNGLWFVKRNSESSQAPIVSNLSPGLPLPTAPQGWTYKAWILASLKDGTWVNLGRFKDVDAPDDSQQFQGPAEPYPFPGEDFIQGQVPGFALPLNLPSTGEMVAFVSLEPQNLTLERPFFSLYRLNLLKEFKAYQNLNLKPEPFFSPQLLLHLHQANS